ncbi:MAG: 30S ribosomal protein S12 methylthiotransferase RimO [Acidaminococcales bacterium]|jgi:ribosomal protein S12 methylthiotransferase|nr:30S ribosomal protein S12 methylthiotransferase RimO [Acidaminococcales bacterium]
MRVKVGLISLGCPKNLADSENMLGILEESGFGITGNPDEADVIIVNTCGFIEQAKEESIEAILQMAACKKTGKCRALVVAGCLGERYADELWAQMPEIDAITRAHGWVDIAGVIARVLKGERVLLNPAAAVTVRQPRKLTAPGVSAYLKIAEGCDNACSYCVIPRIRGPYASKRMEAVLAEARDLAAAGVKEIIVVAQDVTRYGEDLYGKPLLPDLLSEIAKLPEIEWIRILYAYPRHITDDLLDVMAGEKKICKYIDIPLQHASDSVLARMNRKDRKSDIRRILAKMREKMPEIAVRTTFIAGFPGETAAEYAELKDFLLEQRFDRVGIFAYSREEGTAAAAMPQVKKKVMGRRYDELMSLQAEISEKINKGAEGRELTVLVETAGQAGGQRVAEGRSYREAPEIDGVVYLEKAGGCQPGTFVRAKITQGFAYDVLAEVVRGAPG